MSRQTVGAAGRSDLLVQGYGSGVGHCNLSAAQILTAVYALDTWLDTGVAPTSSAFPATLGFVPGFTPSPWPQPEPVRPRRHASIPVPVTLNASGGRAR